jgi:glycosyltransferase involved in cell wall biosynthesis
MMKKISVITICYNEKDSIQKTVESVVSQTARDKIEYLVFDGGSSDGTLEILERFRSSIDVLVSERDKGRYDAMNKGIRASKGEFIIFMNGGDRFYSETVIDDVMKSGLDADIVYGDGLVDRFETLHPLPHVDGVLRPEMFFRNTSLCHQAELIRRDLFARMGLYDLSYSIITDHVFNYRAITRHGATTKYVPIVMARIDETGVTMTRLAQLDAERSRFAKESRPLGSKIADAINVSLGGIYQLKKKTYRFARRLAKVILGKEHR